MAQYALLIVLIVLVVALFITSYVRRKKYNSELGQMREELKIGDKVMTDTGVVGEVVDSYIEDEYKYFVLKSGRGNNVGYFAVHANAIYYVFGKEEPKKQNMANVKKEKKKEEETQNLEAEEKQTENPTENKVATEETTKLTTEQETKKDEDVKTKFNKTKSKKKK